MEIRFLPKVNFLTFSQRINLCKTYQDHIRLLSCIRKWDKIVFIRRKLNIYAFNLAFFWIYGLWTVSAATGGSQLSRNFFLMHLVAKFRGLSETDSVSHTLSLPVGVMRVGWEDGVRCHFSFLVTLACEDDSSRFPLFSSLLRYNACVFNCFKF